MHGTKVRIYILTDATIGHVHSGDEGAMRYQEEVPCRRPCVRYPWKSRLSPPCVFLLNALFPNGHLQCVPAIT